MTQKTGNSSRSAAAGFDYDPMLWQFERLRTVYQLTDAVNRAQGLSAIYEAALQGLERALSIDRSSILLYDQDDVMRFKAWHGLSAEYRAAVEGHSPWPRDAAHPDPVLVPDVLEDETLAGFRDLFAREKIRALGFIPLVTRGRLMGKFMLYFDRPYTLHEEEIRLARTIAGNVAYAVERKRNEEKLALYREIFAHSSEAIAIIDVQGRYVEQNAAHRALIGFGDQELSQKTPSIHLGEERFAEIARVLETEGVYRDDVVSISKTGIRRDIELSAFTVRDEGGAPVCYVGIKRDISERKRMEEALQYLAGASAALDRSLDYDATLEQLARLAVPRLADWAVLETVEADGTMRVAVCAHADPSRTDELERLMRLRGSPAPGTVSDTAMGSTRPLTLARVEDLLGDSPAVTGEARETLRRLGAESAVLIPLRARGRVLGVMTLVSAARAYVDRETALAEDLARRAAIALDNARLYRDAQESDRRKEEFLAVLAHELRNPLAPLLTCLELVSSAGADASSVARWRDVMERQVRNLTRLVDDLLDVSRVTRGKIELQKQGIDVLTVVERAVETSRPLIESRGQRLTVSVDPELRLEVDPLRLEQVMANLLHNAAKYTPEGGHVEVIGEWEDDSIVLRVRDDGVGIAPDMLPRVFDLFAQGGRTPGGLGIGLTLVRTLIELHGGSVKAVSGGPGQGSEFSVRLPAGKPPEPVRSEGGPARESAASGGASERRLCVLVVDDNVDAANVLAEAIRARRHEVHVAHDGRGALELAARTAPDLVLLDLGLPDLDGYEVGRRMLSDSRLKGARLVAISGYGQEQHQRRSAEAGFAHHLVKPIGLAQLDELLKQVPSRASPVS